MLSRTFRTKAKLRWVSLMITAGLSCQVHAELESLEDEVIGNIYGQAAPIIERSGQVTYDAIVYTPADGSPPQLVLPGQSSSDGAVETDQQMTFSGQMFAMPMSPVRIGELDTDNDGISDRGAALFSFQPNVGKGTQFSPLDITLDDNTVNIHDQVFITNQGILILNEAIPGNALEAPGSPGQQNNLTPVKYF